MTRRFTAFAGEHVVAAGDEGEMRRALKAMADDAQGVLLFDDMTGRQVDIDLHASADQEQRGRGRPKMGVQSREITLLPRHWEWLAAQPGGASATLRQLVEQARKASEGLITPRVAMDAAYHFLTVMAGDRPGYEAAIRALYAGDQAAFEELCADWPVAIRDHALALAAPAFA